MASIFRKRTARTGVESRAVSDDELIRRLDPEIPWMGEEPYVITSARHPPRPIIEDLEFYNGQRPHSSLDRMTPDQFYLAALTRTRAA
jgi:transposase InsO family protein